MFGECHAHALMNSVNYRAAVELHKEKVNESAVRKCLEAYKEAGVSFVRDGGDPYGVSELAAKLAPEYGIDYRSSDVCSSDLKRTLWVYCGTWFC